ncbi:sigma-70 family RNA polymerase sigma factor [Desulfotalea psychrophila]|uniref:Probable RNA polymerase sigma-B factor n=1 Tax=Desulfotalea psychrophila (strain LSv54 / DSM 12343) TaxID=177439 RepID=Q6AL54_DESPS|nr:RNA polymerase factor sigma-32 [Desulfotalea psychrophila]CAG36921.1 probable RNA polymerase sigma-B factor [Desulfotalea psychrophila LSv54]
MAKKSVPETSPLEVLPTEDKAVPVAFENPLVAISDNENLPAVSNPALHRYLQEISQYELLTREETDALATRYKESGDQDAAYTLVSSNLRLVVKVAMDFQKYWMQNFMDLIQEGNVGLVQATKKFDPYRGVKFSYYAAYWIRAYVLKFIMDNWRLVKIGTTQAQRKLFFSLNKEKKLLESQGFDPKPKLLAERLNVREKEVIEMGQRMDNWDVSLESPVRSDSDDEQKSFLPSNGPGIESVVAGKEIKVKLTELIDVLKVNLNDKERMILEKRLLTDEPLTLQNIADKFGISRERVRQIEVNLLKKMKKYFEAEMPDIIDYFDGEKIVIQSK